MNIYIETYGCSANQNNGEIIAGLLERAGQIIVQDEKNSDINILNSCIVKGPTLQKMLARVKELSNKKLIVAGCMPSVMSKQILKIAPKAALLGVQHINEIVKAVNSLIENKPLQLLSKTENEPLCKPKNYKNKIIGITQISEGCLGDCSYCLVKLVKGNLHSYDSEKIVKNIQNDIDSGCKEIWLTSQDCSAYGLDMPQKKIFLPELLKKILSLPKKARLFRAQENIRFHVKGKFLVRLGMSNPNHILPILDELVEIYKNPKMFKFLHIPLQSGSDKVLRDMNRHYNADDFKKIVEKLRKEIPGMIISTDIIAGFPTESEKDLEETIELLKETKPDIINIARFWPMPGTKASAMPELKPNIVMKRTEKLMALHNQIALEKNKSFIGKELKSLVDEYKFSDVYVARDLCYNHIIIRSKEKILGKSVDVKIVSADSHHLIGEILN